MISRRRWLAATFTVLCVSLVSVGCGQAASGSKALTKVSFETAWLPGTANQMPWYYAQEAGYYKRAGLDVKIISGKGSVATAQQVAAKNADLGECDLTVMALTHGKGAPLEALFVEFPKSPFGVFAAKSSGVTNFKGLKGHSVLVSAGSVESFLLPPTLKKAGLTMSDVRLINVAPSAKDSDYISGKAPALANEIPGNAPLIVPKRPSNFLYFGDVLPVPYLGIFARKDYIQAHPAVVRAFVHASAQALQKLLNDPKAVQQAANYMGHQQGSLMNAQQIMQAWKGYSGFFRIPQQKSQPLGWMPPQMWQSTIALLHRYAKLNHDLKPADYYTNRFVGGS